MKERYGWPAPTRDLPSGTPRIIECEVCPEFAYVPSVICDSEGRYHDLCVECRKLFASPIDERKTRCPKAITEADRAMLALRRSK